MSYNENKSKTLVIQKDQCRGGSDEHKLAGSGCGAVMAELNLKHGILGIGHEIRSETQFR